MCDTINGVFEEGQPVGDAIRSISKDVVDKLYSGESTGDDINALMASLPIGTPELKSLQKCLSASDTTFWTSILDHCIPYRSLVYVIYALVRTQTSEACIIAASCYITLLTIPGNANVFHDMVARSCMSLLCRWARQGQKQAKRTPTRPAMQEDDNEMPNAFDVDEDGEEETWMEGKNVNEHVYALVCASEALFSGTSLPLKKHPETLTNVVDTMVAISRNQSGDDRFAEKVFATLTTLMKDTHGTPAHTFGVVAKALLPNLMMTFVGVVGSQVPKHSNSVRIAAVNFIIAVGKDRPDVLDSVLVLMEHLCFRSPDKAEFRRMVVQSIDQMSLGFPDLAPAFAGFLTRLARNAKATLRLVTVDIAAQLLTHEGLMAHESTYKHAPGSPAQADSATLEQDAVEQANAAATPSKAPKPASVATPPTNTVAPSTASPQSQLLLALLLSRSSDKAASVRARALICLTDVLDANRTNQLLKSQFQVIVDAAVSPLLGTPSTLELAGPARVSGMQHMRTILRRRSADARPVVRKAAVKALEALFMMVDFMGACPIEADVLSMDDLQVFFDGCMDSVLGVRKEAMLGLSRMLQRYPDSKQLNTIWLGAVLPLTKDRELSVQEGALAAFDTFILQRAIQALKDKDPQATIWQTLGVSDDEIANYVRAAMKLMLKKKTITKQNLRTLYEHLPSCDKKGFWILMEEITLASPDVLAVDPLIKSWNRAMDRESSSSSSTPDITNESMVHTLRCLGNIATLLPIDEAATLASYLFTTLSDFQSKSSCVIVQAKIATLQMVCESLAARETMGEKVPLPPWESELLKACEVGLEEHLRGETVDDLSLVRYLFTLGEVALHTDTHVSTLTKTLVQALVASKSAAGLITDASSSSSSSSSSSAEWTPSTKQKDSPTAPAVRAHAFTALGKLCLKDQAMAKRLVTVFVKELETGESAVIRNNVLVIMCDLCRSFTSVIDNYVPSVTYCLRDTNEMVRRHTVMILTQLLREDYLKFKGSMFFRFLVAMVDDSEKVRNLAEQSLSSVVLDKAGNTVYSSFIQALFFANGCDKHALYSSHGAESDRDAAFSLKESPRRRMVIYRFLLKYMTDEQKFSTTAKLCQDVLSQVADGDMDLEEESVFNVVKDTLLVLASRHIKLRAGKQAEEDEMDEQPSAKQAAANAARGRFLSRLAKKNTLENIVPILIELKRNLERKQSPLLKYLMHYLKELAVDYKAELEDVLAADPQLSAELKYDLRQFAQRQKAREGTREMRRLTITPTVAGQRDVRLSLSTAKTPGRRTPGSTPARPRVAPPVFDTPRLKRSHSTPQPGSAVASAQKPAPFSAPRPACTPRTNPKGSPAPTSESAAHASPLTPLARGARVARRTPGTNSKNNAKGADVYLFSPDKEPSVSKWNVDVRDTENQAPNASPSKAMSKLALSAKKRKRQSPGVAGKETVSPITGKANNDTATTAPRRGTRSSNRKRK